MHNQNQARVKTLMQKGVRIDNPESITIGAEVDLKRISGQGVCLYSGSKIYGASTLILQGAKLGYEGPVTVQDCQIGPEVELKGGFFKQAVFLKKANMGLGAHVRDGTILEEEANGAHTVALKQTILFPFVTLGSLINFCDCFMAGGTSRKDHSEVGSSYIHFNYTPNQDKATASLIGDVPRGVMLDQRPIFLGGQGGLVGPCRLAFGTVVAAGSICRKDELRPSRLMIEAAGKGGNVAFAPGIYSNISKITTNNIIYIANLYALKQWYIHIRAQFMGPEFPAPLFKALQANLDSAVDERIRRLKEFIEKTASAPKSLIEKWPKIENMFENCKSFAGHAQQMETFFESIARAVSADGRDYVHTIKQLKNEEKAAGTQWLQGIVDHVGNHVLSVIT